MVSSVPSDPGGAGDAWRHVTGRSEHPRDVRVLEGSNVKPVEAMTDMIASARRFEMQMKIISSVDENAGKANQLLAMS